MADGQQDRRGDAFDLSYGGINLMARGSIVVLAVINIGGTAVVLWILGAQNVHFDDSLKTSETHRFRQDDVQIAQTKLLGEINATFSAQHATVVDEIARNRLYLREIQRVCMLTPMQRERMQQSLSPTMKELLFRGDTPLEIEAERRQERAR